MNQSGPSASDDLTPAELRRALADARDETAELHRELASLRLRLLQQARGLEAAQLAHADAAPHDAPGAEIPPNRPPATFGRRVKDRLLQTPLRRPLLPIWRLYVESGMRDAVNRVRGAVSDQFRR